MIPFLLSWFISLSAIGFLFEVFFDRWWLVVIGWPLGFVFVKMQAEIRMTSTRTKWRMVFKQFLMVLQTSLATGQSLETSLTSCADELKFMFPQDRHPFFARLDDVNAFIRSGTPAESAIEALCHTESISEIRDFTDMMISVKRKSGDLLDTVRKTSQILSEKMDIEQEISLAVANKRYEARLMLCVPLFLLAALKGSASDYMQPLYEQPLGLLIASFACVLYLCSLYGVERMLRYSWEE
jgi:tight adherence protein B